jgi:hypothetical protein
VRGKRDPCAQAQSFEATIVKASNQQRGAGKSPDNEHGDDRRMAEKSHFLTF